MQHAWSPSCSANSLRCRPMAMQQSIKARLGATRLVLEQTVMCSDYVAISELQSKGLIDMLAKESLSDEDAAVICGAVAAIKWALPIHMNAVIATLVAKPAVAAAKRARRSGQNFSPISNYFTADMWVFLTATSSPDSAKLSGILSFAANMGMRTPSEPTLKWLASLWQVCCCNEAQLAKKSDSDKRIALMTLKSAFAAMKPKLQDPPVEWVEVLPDEPSVFMDKCKRLWAQGMKGDHPGVPLIDMKRVAELDMTYGCRGGRAMSHFAVRDRSQAAASPHHVGNARLGCDPMERMASMFMESMENMLAGQQRMLELTMNTQQRVPKAAGLLGAMLEDRHQQFVISPKRREQLALPAPQQEFSPVQVRQPQVEELPDSPQQQAAQAALAVAARPAAATTGVAVDLRTVGKPNAEETEAVPAHISLFLGALDARKVDKKAKKLTMAATVELLRVGEASMPSKKKNKKNKHKNKKSAKSKTTPKKVAEQEDALIAKAKDTTEATPATKASKAKAAGTSSKGGDKGKGKGKAMHKKGLILGCAKCRWSVKGCGQCRSESFSGHRWNITC